MKIKLYSQGFLAFCIFYLLLLLIGKENWAWWLKPLLIPFLIIIVLISEPVKTKKVLLTALFFSWVGDILLMFTELHPLYFIFGLISFLLAHLTYIFLFVKQPKINKHSKYVRFLPIVLAYLVVILGFLWSTLHEMKFPVTVYAIVISAMLFMSIKAFFQWEKPSNQWVLSGAFLFVLSDSILAVNKFHSPLPLSSFWIMCTYLGAQYCLVMAIIKNKKTASFEGSS